MTTQNSRVVVGDGPQENVELVEEPIVAEGTTETVVAETPAEITTATTATTVETPGETTPSPVEVSTPAPDVLTEADRQELTQLRTARAEMVQFRVDQQSELQLRQLEADYNARGIDPEMAKYMAQEIRAERMRWTQQLNQVQITAQTEQGRRNASIHYGKQYGVPAEELVDFDTPAQMEKHARVLAHTVKVDKRLTAVEKKQVAEQDFDGGQGTTGGPRTPIDLLAYYGNNPDMEITAEHKKTLEDAGFG